MLSCFNANVIHHKRNHIHFSFFIIDERIHYLFNHQQEYRSFFFRINQAIRKIFQIYIHDMCVAEMILQWRLRIIGNFIVNLVVMLVFPINTIFHFRHDVVGSSIEPLAKIENRKKQPNMLQTHCAALDWVLLRSQKSSYFIFRNGKPRHLLFDRCGNCNLSLDMHDGKKLHSHFFSALLFSILSQRIMNGKIIRIFSFIFILNIKYYTNYCIG